MQSLLNKITRLRFRLLFAFALVIAVGVIVTVVVTRQGTATQFAHFMVNKHLLRPEPYGRAKRLAPVWVWPLPANSWLPLRERSGWKVRRLVSAKVACSVFFYLLNAREVT